MIQIDQKNILVNKKIYTDGVKNYDFVNSLSWEPMNTLL